MNQKRDLIDFLTILVRWKKKLLIVFFVALVSSIVISLFLPFWYESRAKILIPSQQAGGLDIGSFLGNVPIDISPQPTVSLSRMEAIFKSRQLVDNIITKFNLQELYGHTYNFQTREEFIGHMVTELDYSENSVVLRFEYEEDPQKSKEICQYILDQTNLIYNAVQSKEAKNNRIFTEQLYNDALDRLAQNEDSLRNFQKKYGTYILEEQIKATIESHALLEQKLIESRTEFRYLSNLLKSDYSRLSELKLRITTLENQIIDMQTKSDQYSVLIPLKSAPDWSFEYYRLEREITILVKVLEFLTPQYERAVIEENKSSPSYIILDQPSLPEYKSRPKRAFVVIGIVGTVIIIFIIYILIKEYLTWVRDNDPAKYSKLREIFSSIYIKLN